MGTRAGVYTRLSRLKEDPELTRLALLRQDEDTLKLCAERGYEVATTYPDPGISADDAIVREQFEQALRDLGDGTIDVLVIPKFDRMTRGLGTWLRIERVLLDTGRLIVSATDGDLDPSTPAGKFMLRQRAQMAEYELDQMKARVRRWHKQRAYAGKPLVSGRRPFGYATKDRSEVDPAEADVIVWAAEKILAGKSLRSVVADVADLGMTAPSGKPWRIPNFRQMLLSPGLAGIRTYQGAEVASGGWPAILDRTTWTKLGARLNGTPRKEGRPAVRYLLSGLVRCGRCGEAMHSTKSPRGVRQYACRKRPGAPQCGHLVIYAEPVETLVGAEVLAHLSEGGLAAAVADLGDAKADAAHAELADAERDRDELEDMKTSGAIKRDAFLRMHGPAEARVEAARRALKAVSGRSVLADLPVDAAELAAWWNDAADDERREVVQATLDRVVIRPSGPRMSRFDAGRVVIPPDAWKV
jgi:DNA invertase Pin-like site-specific DNA recombinase